MVLLQQFAKEYNTDNLMFTAKLDCKKKLPRKDCTSKAVNLKM